MYAVSQEFLNQMKAPVRRVDARVTIDYTDPTLDQDIEVTASEQANVSYPAQTADFATEPAHKWAALDGAWVLDGTWHLAPVPEDAYLYQMGWWSAQVAGEDGRFSEPYPTLILTHPARPVTTFQLVGDSARGEWPTEFAIRLYGPDGTLLRERVVTGNTEIKFYELLDPPALDVTRQELEIRAWSHPGRHAKILEFFTSLQETYEGNDLFEVHLLEESESGNGVGTGGVTTNEITVRLINRGDRFGVTNPQSPFRELLRPNRRVRAWLGIRGAGDLWGDGWYAPFDRDLAVARRDGAVLEPLPGYVATLRPGEGRFGGAVAVEEGTENKIATPTTFAGWARLSGGAVLDNDGSFYPSQAKFARVTTTDWSFESNSIPAANGQTWSVSYIARRGTGDGEPRAAIMIMNASNTHVSNIYPTFSSRNIGGGWVRYEATFTINYANTGYIRLRFYVTATNGGYHDFALPQLEQKPFATSFVDGTRAVGRLMYPGAIPSNEGTLLIWAKKNTLEPNTIDRFRKILDAQLPRIDFQWDESGRLSANFGGASLSIPDPAQDLDWHQYAITYSGRTVKMYFDGQLVASGQAQEDLVNFSELCVGARWDGRGAGNALYDELLILPYAASEEHIAELYRETRPLYDEWVPLGVFWSTDWDSEELEAMVRARDRMELLRRTTYEPGPLKQNVSLYELAQDVLTHAKMPPETYRLDPGLQDIVVPWGWVPPGSHRDALRIIAEAGLARAYCDRDGILRIERVTVPTGAPVLAITSDDYFPPARHPVTSSLVANRVVVTTQPLVPASSPEEVYRATVEVPAGQTIAVRAEYNKRPVIDAAASLESPPAGVSIVEDTYGAASAEVMIRNTGASAASVTLVITGRPLSVEGGEQVAEEDELSIRELGLIVHEVPSNPLVQTSDHARAIAQAILARSAEQRRDVELEWRGNPALEVDDLVRVDGVDVQVVRQELSWAGALSARLVARRLD